MTVKVGTMAERWLSDRALWLISGCKSGYCGLYVAVKVGIMTGGGCQSGYCGWYVVVKVVIMVGMRASKWVLRLVNGCQSWYRG